MKSLCRAFERIYHSAHQLPYDDPSADNLFEHVVFCFKDPECLREMSNFLKIKTELPVNLWLDSGRSYKKSGHFKRIKFQKDKSNRIDQNNFAEMDLNGKILEKTNHGTSLSKKEDDEVRNFVLNNQHCLDLLSDSIIYEQDFLDIMITSGEPASELDKQIQKNELETILRNYE